VSVAFQERRQPRSFRILYTPFDVFVRRFVLRGETPTSTEAPTATAPAPSGEKLAAWKCGVPKLDEPSEALFKAIRLYQTTFKAGGGPGATEDMLAFLEGHVDGHLPLEEVYLEHIHFPGLPEHRQGHQAFQHQIHAIRDRVANGDANAGLELSQVLYAWMREHILKEDAVWCAFAKARRRRVTTS
jgi:hemerythrin-like metal-binding protein